MDSSYLPCQLKAVNLKDSNVEYDCMVVIQDDMLSRNIKEHVESSVKFDKAFTSDVSCFKCDGKATIYSPLDFDDYSDVRDYHKAGKKAIERALKGGFTAPLLVLPSSPKFKNGELLTLLGALDALYVPIQYREDVPSKAQRLSVLRVAMEDNKMVESLIKAAVMIESGLYVSRDIGGADPERMSPPNVAKYVEKAFAGGNLKMNIISDPKIFKTEYPLFEAVDRAASVVERHAGRIIFLEYKPPRPAKKTVMLVGKGVTYDTGGADIKAGGVMAGMSRDKCGAAGVAGFMKLVEMKQPEDVHFIAALCMVRNSVGEECYVADEIITSRAGIRVRVGNTDAEGRMAMADALAVMKERVITDNLPDPHLYTVATLTGHVCIALGDYTCVMDNKVAENAGHGESFCKAGEIFGDPAEISALRREDFDFHRSKAYGEDLLQCNNLPSTRTPRGHQTPAAFIIMASGLDKHGVTSTKPIKYSHVDIAGSAGDIPFPPTGASILTLAKMYLFS